MAKYFSLILSLFLSLTNNIQSQEKLLNTAFTMNYLNENSHDALFNLGINSSDNYILSDFGITENLGINIMLSHRYVSQTSQAVLKVTGRYVTSSDIAFGGAYASYTRGGEITLYSVFPFKVAGYNFHTKVGVNYYNNSDFRDNPGYFFSLSKNMYNYNNINIGGELLILKSKYYESNLHYNTLAINANFDYKVTGNVNIAGFLGIDFFNHIISGLNAYYTL